jgi:hypothetical protein
MERYNSSENTSEYIGSSQELQNIVDRIEEVGESRLGREEMIRELKPLVKEMLQHIQDDLHFELTEDVTALYNEMSKEDLLARVESVKKVISCMVKNEPITVGVGGDHYANSVTSDSEGLRIAMAEAEALGPIRLLVGLDIKALIGFQSDHLVVSEIEDNNFDLRDTSLRKAYCRHIEGEIRRGDIRYMVLRVPGHLFPEEKLTSEEKVAKLPFVFRGIRVSSGVHAEELLQAA